MSRKTELIEKLTAAKGILDNYNADVARISSDPALSADGKSAKVAKLKASAVERLDAIRDEALQIVNAARVDTDTVYKRNSLDKLSDADYQAGVDAVVKALNENAITERDIRAIVEKYRDDVIALNRFKSAAREGTVIYRAIPGDRRIEIENTHNELIKDINTFISESALNMAGATMNRLLAERYLYAPLNEDLLF